MDRLILARPVRAFGSEPGRGTTFQPPRPRGAGSGQVAAIIDVGTYSELLPGIYAVGQ